MTPIKIILKPSYEYGYLANRAECSECGEEIEDETGIVKCNSCGAVMECVEGEEDEV